MHVNTEVANFLQQCLGTSFVELPWHQPRSKLNHVSIKSKIKGRFRSFQSQQSTSDDGAGPGPLRILNNVFKVFDGAINKNALILNSRHWRHERKRSRGHDQFVIIDLHTLHRSDRTSFPINVNRTVAKMQFNADGRIPFHSRQHQLFGIAMGEEIRQADTVIRSS